ncbi:MULTISPECIES: Mini-ribonuclease 3 [Thermoactinomyces]|jgi:ribonuclease III family protein|nr:MULTISPECIES: Mini-ribonuclease 3 [Thermoactinomyces]
MKHSLLGMMESIGKAPEELNPLLLAYLGDAVYEVFIRSHLVARGVSRPHDLQKEATRYVSAGAQAKIYRELEGELADEEREILKRGRNAKSGSVPKKAKVTDYRMSTGLEALVGYLYCRGDEERLSQLMQKAIATVEKETDSDE